MAAPKGYRRGSTNPSRYFFEGPAGQRGCVVVAYFYSVWGVNIKAIRVTPQDMRAKLQWRLIGASAQTAPRVRRRRAWHPPMLR